MAAIYIAAVTPARSVAQHLLLPILVLCNGTALRFPLCPGLSLKPAFGLEPKTS
jgi:hypothetical protein